MELKHISLGSYTIGRGCLPNSAFCRVSLLGMSSAVTSTSMLPLKAGVRGLVRIGADK